jgi:hypothetical protein
MTLLYKITPYICKIPFALEKKKKKLHVATLLNEPFHFFFIVSHMFSFFPKFSLAISLPHLPFSEKLKNRIVRKNTILIKKLKK